MTKAKTRRKRTRARKRKAMPHHADHVTVTIGQRVHRGKGKRLQHGVITGWSYDRKRRLTWIVSPAQSLNDRQENDR